MKTALRFLVATLGACSWPTGEHGRLVSGTIAFTSAETGAALVQPGPFISVLDRIVIRATSGGATVSQTIQLQRYDSTASATIELAPGPASFDVEVLSSTGAVVYSGNVSAEVEEGFSVQVPLTALRPILVVQPDTLKTVGQFSGQFIVYNAGSQLLNWRLSAIDPRLCGDGCSVSPESGSVAPKQFASFTASIGDRPSTVFTFTVSSSEGDVPVRWSHTYPPITSVTVTPDVGLIGRGQLLFLSASVQPVGNSPVSWRSSDTRVATVSTGGVVTPLVAGSVTITAESQFDPSKRGTALVRVYEPTQASWFITAPSTVDTVRRDITSDSVVTLRAVLSGPSSIANPFTVVEFWARSFGTGTWIRVSQNSTPTVTDIGNTRNWTFTSIWNPTTTTAPYANPSVTRLDLIAIGVASTGVATATPMNNQLWLRVP